jgi:hypothetical protein
MKRSCADGECLTRSGLGFGLFRDFVGVRRGSVFGFAIGLGGVEVGRGLELSGTLCFWDGFGFGRGGVGSDGLEVVAFEFDEVGAGFIRCFQLDRVGAGFLAEGGGLGGVGLHGDLFLDGVVELAGHLFKLLDAGEFVDVLEAEAEEEVLGGFVEDGAADDLFAAGVTSLRVSSEPRTPAESTPRISETSGAVTGCL